MAWESAVTKAGVALLNKWATGGTLTIDRAAAGTGFVNSDELADQTQLSQEKYTVSIVDKKDVDEGAQIKVSIQAAEEDYNLNQIGIFGKLDQGESTLIALYQNKDGIPVPSTSEMAEFVYEFYAVLKISNDGEMKIIYDPNAYVTNKTLLEVEERLEWLLKRAAHALYSATVPLEGWQPDEQATGLYSVTVPVQGLAVGDSCVYFSDLVQTGEEKSVDMPAREAYTLVTRITAAAGQITVYAERAPEAAIPLHLVMEEVQEGTGTTEVMILRRGGSGVHAQSIKDAVVELDQDNWTFDESEHCPVIQRVTLRGQELTLDKDYMPIYSPATNAGTYYVVVWGIDKYGSGVRVPWTIQQAAGRVSVSSQSLTVKGVMGTTDSSVIVTRAGDGAITAESLAPQYATAEIVEGNKVKVTSVKAGEARIKIKVAETNNYAATETELTVTVEKATGSISVQPPHLDIEGAIGSQKTATLEYTGNGNITIGTDSCLTIEREGKTLTVTSKASGDATIKIELAETEDYTGASCTLTVNVRLGRIWGVKKNKTGTKWTRTGAAALYQEPSPAVGTGSGSSPFDGCAPWDFQDTIDGDDYFVKISKSWMRFGVDEDGMLTIEVADYKADDFATCPACMDRGDGEGERDYVLVGKYHCDSQYKSRPNQKPITNITRAQARSGCAGRGEGYCQFDLATRMTIDILYLVEYADYDSQTCIGYGCGNNSSVENTGRTDTMQYHTGTNMSSRTTYGDGVKYRGIEGLWSGVFDWLDGIYIKSGKIYAILNPKKFSDTDNGTEVATVPSSTGYVKAMAFSKTKGFEWVLLPSEMGGTETEGVSDNSLLGSSDVVVYAGGCYYQSRNYGLFCLSSNSVGHSSSYRGARLLKLPKGGAGAAAPGGESPSMTAA